MEKEYWGVLPFPIPGDFLDPGTEPRSPALQADSLPSEPPGRFFSIMGYYKTLNTVSYAIH